MEDVQRLSLMVLRLMDADLLLCEEGNAILAEIEAFKQAWGETRTESVATSSERIFLMVETLMQTNSSDALTPGQAQEIVRRILHQADGVT